MKNTFVSGRATGWARAAEGRLHVSTGRDTFKGRSGERRAVGGEGRAKKKEPLVPTSAATAVGHVGGEARRKERRDEEKIIRTEREKNKKTTKKQKVLGNSNRIFIMQVRLSAFAVVILHT